ncbi:hypothetical protein [Yinghuangia sp. YIM S10712]|uniref:hypothetical protein n=1 Tax=Yinghuangia sp. YIM S10712 TaxID=3436930 RepID=UPI003F5398A1
MPRDTSLTAFLSTPFTAAAAAERGHTLSVIRRWLREGEVRRVIQGVYVGNHVPDSPTLRARAVTALVPGAVICGRTAAWLWGITAAGREGRDGRPLPVEVIVPRAATPPRRSGCLGRSWLLGRGDTTTIAGLALTTPLRTAADIGRSVGSEDAVVILDAFLHLRQVTKRQLEGVVDRFAGYAGVRRLADAVRLADGRSANEDESRLRIALARAGVPPPEPGWRVMSAFGRPLHRFGMAWPLLRLGVDIADIADIADVADATGPPGEGPGAVARQLGHVGAWPAVRVRHRHIAGSTWRVVECGPHEPTRHRETVVAQILRELRGTAGAGAQAA